MKKQNSRFVFGEDDINISGCHKLPHDPRVLTELTKLFIVQLLPCALGVTELGKRCKCLLHNTFLNCCCYEVQGGQQHDAITIEC